MLSLTSHTRAVGIAKAIFTLYHAIYFHFALLGNLTSYTRMYAELLGPCYKTGRS